MSGRGQAIHIDVIQFLLFQSHWQMVGDRGHFLVENVADIVGTGHIFLKRFFRTKQQSGVAILVTQ